MNRPSNQTKGLQDWSALDLSLCYLLAQEERHRLANSLQLILNSFEQQAAAALSEDTRQALFRTRDKIAGLGRLHNMLYRPIKSGATSCWSYLGELCILAELLMTAPRNLKLSWSVSREAENLEAESGQVHLLGLIVYELITNSAKRAFRDNVAGNIFVHLGASGGELVCAVSDNGLGKTLHTDDPASQGLNYISQIAEGARGTCRWAFGPRGTKAEVRLPLQSGVAGLTSSKFVGEILAATVPS